MAGRMLPPVTATLAASDEDFNAKLDSADAKMIATSALMDDLGKDHPINLSVDTASADAKIAATDAELAALGGDHNVKVGATGDTSAAGADLRALGDDADTAARDIDKIKPATDGAGGGLDNLDQKAKNASSSLGGGSGGGGGLLAAILPLAPALIPIAGIATGTGIALAGMATAGIGGLAAFALAAGPQLTTMKTQMGGLLTSFQAINAPTVLPVLNSAVGLFGTALQAANPLVGATSTALLGLETRAKSALQSPAWANFTTYIDASAGPAITTFGTVLGDLGHGFGNLLIAFAPVETQMETGLVHLSQGFLNWTSSTGGVHSFVTWFQAEAPQVGQLIENLARLVGLMLPAFGGWGQILIQVANPLLSLVDALFRINPIIGDITAALVIGGLAWSKWGSGISTAFTATKAFVDGSSPFAQKLAALGTAGATASTGVSSVGSSAEKAGVSLGGAGGSAAVLGTGLATLGVGIAAAAVVLGVYAAGSAIADGHQRSMTDAINEATKSLSGQAASTLPQLNAALTSNNALLAQSADQFLNLNGWTQEQTAFMSANTAVREANNAATHSTSDEAALYLGVQTKVWAENQSVHASIAILTSNLGLLSSKYDISKASALGLANSLGLNLNKALTGLQVTQVGAEMDQMSQSAGITRAALENLATTSKTSMTAVSTSITKAEQATQTSFAAAGDAVTAFSGQTAVTGQQIQWFYGSAVSQAQSFTANIRSAITDGYDPTLISQLLTAGPAQAGPLLQSLVDNASTGMVQTVATATSALNSLNVQAVQQQRITSEAVHAGTSQMAADVGTAFAIQQQVTIQGVSATVASVNQVLGLGVNQVQTISDEYSLGLPNAFQTQQANTYLMAQAQAQQGVQGFLSQLGATQGVATQHSVALPNSLFGKINDTFANAAANSWAVSHGLDSAAGAVANSASWISQTASNWLRIPDTTWIGFDAGNAIAQGLASTIGTVQMAAMQVSTAAIQGVQAGAAAVNSAASSFMPHFPPATAIGGTFTYPQVRLIAEAGTETVLPWNDPGRVASLLGAMPSSAFSALDSGMSASGGAGALTPAGSGGRGGGPVTINININGANQDLRSLAAAVRNELLQIARTMPGLGLS